MKHWRQFVLAWSLALAASPALASFHQFAIQQIYSNADGTVQFAVLRESAGANGEGFWAGHTLTSKGAGGERVYTFPRDLASQQTANRNVLVATQGFAALNLIAPDYVVPNGFFAIGAGSLDFAGVDVVNYPSLPIDGTNARYRNGIAAPSFASNLAGQGVALDPGKLKPAVPAAVNYEGLWWRAPGGSESGWGLNLAHQGDTIFATWFTYAADGRAWWLSMTAQKTATGTYTGTLIETRGPAFSSVPFKPADVTLAAVGTGTLTFTGNNSGTFAYTVNGVMQSKPIEKQLFGPALARCTFGAQPDLALATNYQNLWWNAPGGSESGWGINFTHQGDIVYATWFTYAFDGAPLWLAATAVRTGPGLYSGTLYALTGPPFSAEPFLSADINLFDVGTLTLAFANGNSAAMSYSVNVGGPVGTVTQTKTIERQVFAPPGTVCQ